MAQVTTVKKIRSGKYQLPKDKMLPGSPVADSDGFMNIPEGADEELPF